MCHHLPRVPSWIDLCLSLHTDDQKKTLVNANPSNRQTYQRVDIEHINKHLSTPLRFLGVERRREKKRERSI